MTSQITNLPRDEPPEFLPARHVRTHIRARGARGERNREHATAPSPGRGVFLVFVGGMPHVAWKGSLSRFEALSEAAAATIQGSNAVVLMAAFMRVR